MKRSPEMARLEEILRSSKLVHGGFLGNDTRPLEEIIEADAADLARTGYSREDVAKRMQEITDLARQGIETTVLVGPGLEARAFDSRGQIPCPWDHPGRYLKTVVEAWRQDSGLSVRWSDLSVHMIETHGFFEGRGSAFRLEPVALTHVLFGRRED